MADIKLKTIVKNLITFPRIWAIPTLFHIIDVVRTYADVQSFGIEAEANRLVRNILVWGGITAFVLFVLIAAVFISALSIFFLSLARKVHGLTKRSSEFLYLTLVSFWVFVAIWGIIRSVWGRLNVEWVSDFEFLFSIFLAYSLIISALFNWLIPRLRRL